MIRQVAYVIKKIIIFVSREKWSRSYHSIHFQYVTAFAPLNSQINIRSANYVNWEAKHSEVEIDKQIERSEVFIFSNKKKMCKNHCVNACSSWQLWIKPILVLLYILFVICVVPWLIVETVKDGFTREDQLIWLGGLFVLTAIPLCIWHIVQHMLHFTKPILQKVSFHFIEKSFYELKLTYVYFLAHNSHTLDGAYLCGECSKWLDPKFTHRDPQQYFSPSSFYW